MKTGAASIERAVAPAPAGDLVALAGGAVAAHRLRSFLSMLGIAIGVASPIEVSRITEAIPMAMPSMESAERRRCPRIERQARATRSRTPAV